MSKFFSNLMSKRIPKKSPTINSIPSWVLAIAVVLNFFIPNTPTTLLISVSLFFSVIGYIILFGIYSKLLLENKIPLSELIEETKQDSKFDSGWQIAATSALTVAVFFDDYGPALKALALLYVVFNIGYLLFKWVYRNK